MSAYKTYLHNINYSILLKNLSITDDIQIYGETIFYLKDILFPRVKKHYNNFYFVLKDMLMLKRTYKFNCIEIMNNDEIIDILIKYYKN
jgi:hypothetical protein